MATFLQHCKKLNKKKLKDFWKLQRHFYLQKKIKNIYIYICVCVCDTGKVQQNVPRARYFSFLQKCCQSQVFPMPQGCIKGSCLYISPWTRKQKSFHMSRRVSLVNPTASYSTTPLCSQNRVILIIDNIIV